MIDCFPPSYLLSVSSDNVPDGMVGESNTILGKQLILYPQWSIVGFLLYENHFFLNRRFCFIGHSLWNTGGITQIFLSLFPDCFVDGCPGNTKDTGSLTDIPITAS